MLQQPAEPRQQRQARQNGAPVKVCREGCEIAQAPDCLQLCMAPMINSLCGHCMGSAQATAQGCGLKEDIASSTCQVSNSVWMNPTSARHQRSECLAAHENTCVLAYEQSQVTHTFMPSAACHALALSCLGAGP